jgi:hypothetical protein
VGGLGLVLAAVIVVTVLSLGSSSHAKKGCLNATVPGPIGAMFFKQCGAAAQEICSHVNQQHLSAFSVEIVTKDCRRAGFPVD